MKHASDSAASDTLSQRLDDLEEVDDQETKNGEAGEQRQEEGEICGENDSQKDVDAGT